MEDFNINEIIGTFLSNKADDIALAAKNSLKTFNNEVSIALKSKYSKYLKNATSRYGKTRSFFIRDNPKPLYQFYEPIGIKSGEIIYEKATIQQLTNSNSRCVILGSGGAGKSILLKHLLLDSLKVNYKVPVFIELRDSNYKDQNFLDLISSALKTFELDINEDYLIRALEEGHFLILLDGLDEVKSSLRSDLIKEIENFSKLYEKCAYIITTRPDDKINEFELFTFFSTLPLSLEQSVSLVSKLPAEEEIKKKFIEDLKSGLFEKHISFLSNPLLLSIMMLTYGFSADIPSKLSIFYNQAYEALYQRHDALKGAYKRDRESDLDIVSFERVLSAFCILSYDERKFLFSRMEALNYIKKGADLVGINTNQEHVFNDLLQAVCFLIQDGLFYTFTHRSFQEYFTAKFIANTNDIEIKKKLLEKFYPDLRRDSIYDLVYELDTTFFETQIILPFLKSFFDSIGVKKAVGKTNFLKFLKILFDDIKVDLSISKDSLAAQIKDTKTFHMTQIALYQISSLNSFNSYETSDENFDKRVISECESKGLQKMVYKTSTMKTTDKFFNELYESKTYFSPTRLQYLLDAYNFLTEKHRVINSDLNNLISKKASKKH